MSDYIHKVKKEGERNVTSIFLNNRHENASSSEYGKKNVLFIHIDSQRGLLLRIWVKLLPVSTGTHV